MNWKKVYEFLETSDEGKEILSEVKESVKSFDDVEAKLRLSNKDRDEAIAKVTDLESKTTTVNTEKSKLEQDFEILQGKFNKIELDKEADTKALNEAKSAQRIQSIKDNVSTDMSTMFGARLGGLMTNEYITDGSLSINEDGVRTLKVNGALYEGDEVIEQIRTMNPNDVVGESGTGTTGGVKASAKVVDVSNLSANEAFDMAFDSLDI